MYKSPHRSVSPATDCGAPVWLNVPFDAAPDCRAMRPPWDTYPLDWETGDGIAHRGANVMSVKDYTWPLVAWALCVIAVAILLYVISNG